MSRNKIFKLEAIIGEKIGEDGKPRYLAKWDGYHVSEATWEPAGHFHPETIQAWAADQERLRDIIGEHSDGHSNVDELQHSPSQGTNREGQQEMVMDDDDAVNALLSAVEQTPMEAPADHRNDGAARINDNVQSERENARQSSTRRTSVPASVLPRGSASPDRVKDTQTLDAEAKTADHVDDSSSSSESDDTDLLPAAVNRRGGVSRETRRRGASH